MKTVKAFVHRGFDVTIGELDGRYYFAADNGIDQVGVPNPNSKDGKFPTAEDAEDAAKEVIFMYEITAMFVKLPGPEKAFIGYVVKQIYEGAWEVGPNATIIREMKKAGDIRLRR